MAEVMLDRMHRAGEFLVRQGAREIARHVGPVAAMAQALQHIGRAHALGEDIGELAPTVGAVVAVDRDMVDVGQRDACFGQAVADRFTGEPAPMLDAAETLLLDGGQQHAVLHQAGRGIGVVGVEAQDIGHRSRSRRSRCMERITSAVTRWAV